MSSEITEKPQQAQQAQRSTTARDLFSNIEPLWKTSRDARGRRTMLFRHAATQEETTFSSCIDRLGSDAVDIPMKRFLHRIDATISWLMFDRVRWGPLRAGLQTVCLPLAALGIGWHFLRLRWEVYRSGGRGNA